MHVCACRQTGRYSRYSAFMFLNSGVRGPYVPSWVPPGWQWTMAFTHKLQGDVGAVSSSVTCLPPLGEVTSVVSAPAHDLGTLLLLSSVHTNKSGLGWCPL